MGEQSARGWFEHCMRTDDPDKIMDAARRMAPLNAIDALRVVSVLAAKDDSRYDEAAARWAARIITERRLDLEGSRTILDLLEALPDAPEHVQGLLRRYC